MPEVRVSARTAIATWLGGMSAQDIDGVVIPPQKLGLLARSGRFRAIARPGRDSHGPFAGEPRQITSVEANEGYVAWIETPSADLYGSEWVLRSFDRRTHRIVDVDRSPQLKAGHRIIPEDDFDTPIGLIGDEVYWATAVPLNDAPDPNRAKDWSWRILRHRLDGRGLTTTVAREAAFGAVDGDDLFYATRIASASNLRGYRIHRRHGGAGPDNVMVVGATKGGASLTNLTAGDGRLVWTVSSSFDDPEPFDPQSAPPGDLYVMQLSDERVTKVVLRDEAGGNYSIAFGADDLVLWNDGSGNEDHHLYALSTDQNGGAGPKLFRLADHTYAIDTNAWTHEISWNKDCPTSKYPQRECWATAKWIP